MIDGFVPQLGNGQDGVSTLENRLAGLGGIMPRIKVRRKGGDVRFEATKSHRISALNIYRGPPDCANRATWTVLAASLSVTCKRDHDYLCIIAEAEREGDVLGPPSISQINFWIYRSQFSTLT